MFDDDRHIEEFTKRLKLIITNLEKLVLEFVEQQKASSTPSRGQTSQSLMWLQVRNQWCELLTYFAHKIGQ